MAYDELSPIGDVRGDWQAASIASILANIAAARGRSRKRFTVKDFLLEFGSTRERPEAPRKSWQEMKMIGQMCAMALTEKVTRPPKKKRK